MSTIVNWCVCKGHDDKDWTVRSKYYARHFIPSGWMLEYGTALEYEDGRILYMTGSCDCCGGFMRSGVGLALNISGDRFYVNVYWEMNHYRPYEGYDSKKGVYHGYIGQRGEWYQQQDDLTPEERNRQFLNLFRAEDRADAEDWLTRNAVDSQQNIPRRDRKRTLFQRILEAARADGSITEAKTILQCSESPIDPSENSYLTDYRFNVVPTLVFCREAIFLELYLEGSFDASGETRAIIGAFKAPRTDQEACQLMGALGGVLMYHAREYMKREIHRYIPEKELERGEDTI